MEAGRRVAPQNCGAKEAGLRVLALPALWTPLRFGQNLFGPLLGVHARMSIAGYTRESYFRDLVKAS